MAFVVGLTVSVMVMVVLMIIAVLVLHWRRHRFSMRFNIKEVQWEDQLYRYLVGDCSLQEIAATIRGDYRLYWHFLMPICATLQGDDRRTLNRLALDLGLNDFFLNDLQTSRLSLRRKATAARVLGMVGETRARPYLLRLLEHRDMGMVVVAAEAIAHLGEVDDVFAVIRALFSSQTITFEGATAILLGFGPGICPELCEVLSAYRRDGSSPLHGALGQTEAISLFLDILGHHQWIEVLEPIQEILAEPHDDEVVIHCFKALTKIGYALDEVDVSPFLTHSNWVIRSQAARFVGITREERYLNQLEELVADTYWWVRYHAAFSLVSLGPRGVGRLKAAANTPGGAAHQTAVYVLARQSQGLLEV